jgi:hypothetical protein
MTIHNNFNDFCGSLHRFEDSLPLRTAGPFAQSQPRSTASGEGTRNGGALTQNETTVRREKRNQNGKTEKYDVYKLYVCIYIYIHIGFPYITNNFVAFTIFSNVVEMVIIWRTSSNIFNSMRNVVQPIFDVRTAFFSQLLICSKCSLPDM